MLANLKNLFSYFIISISLAFTSLPAQADTNKKLSFNSIVFFGDSLSDNGNLYGRSWYFLPKSPPYFQGRFSNGEVWAERAATYFNDIYHINSVNYAVGGEVISLHLGAYLPWTLFESVSSYLSRDYYLGSHHDLSRVLYVIWIGGNDYLDGADDVEGYTTNAITNLQYSMETLISYGAQNFLLVNIPDLSKTPYAASIGKMDNIADLTKVHNKKLALLAGNLLKQYAHVHLALYDMNALFNEFLTSPEKANKQYNLHIVNFTNPCWGGGYTIQRKPANVNRDNRKDEILIQNQLAAIKPLNILANHLDTPALAQAIVSIPSLNETYRVAKLAASGTKSCLKPDEYLFWDKIHPTSVIHRVVADQLVQYIEKNFNNVQ